MIPEEDKQIIRRFMADVDCQKGFSCLSAGPQNLCKARDIGSDLYLECLEDVPEKCSFSMPFGDTNFCKCAIRIYLAHKRPPVIHPNVTGTMDTESLGLNGGVQGTG